MFLGPPVLKGNVISSTVDMVPSVAYSVTVDHSRRILSATVGHPGSRYDKTIIQFDKYVQGLRSGTLYPGKQFNVFNERGGLVRLAGLYLQAITLQITVILVDPTTTSR